MVKRLQQIIILLACLSVVAVVAVQRDGKLLGNSVFKEEKTGNTNKIDTLRTLEDGTIIINTSYLAKDIKGFGGAVPLDIYIKNGKILEVKALHNSETPEFFQEASQLLTRWNGETLDEALKIKVDGVSGATFSSRGIIGNMQAGLRYAAKNAQETSLFDKMDLRTKTLVGLLVVFMAAMIPLFVKDKRYRVFQLLLNFVVLGLWGGTFISWSVIVGYMSGGINVWISLVPIIMLITAFNKANAEQRAELEKWINKRNFNTEEKIEAVTRLYNEIGVDKLAKEKMDFYYEQGKKFLNAVKLPKERKEALAEYAARMMKRQK